MFSMQCRKNNTVEDNNKKKRMNIANLINIAVQIYISILYVTKITQNKNYLINLILHYGCVVDKYCCVVLSTSGFPYFTLCPRQCKWKVATTYLAITTKKN